MCSRLQAGAGRGHVGTRRVLTALVRLQAELADEGVLSVGDRCRQGARAEEKRRGDRPPTLPAAQPPVVFLQASQRLRIDNDGYPPVRAPDIALSGVSHGRGCPFHARGTLPEGRDAHQLGIPARDPRVIPHPSHAGRGLSRIVGRELAGRAILGALPARSTPASGPRAQWSASHPTGAGSGAARAGFQRLHSEDSSDVPWMVEFMADSMRASVAFGFYWALGGL